MSFKRMAQFSVTRQSGAALAVSLLLLLVLTLVAVTAMDNSNLGFKMSANSVYHDEAFNYSESAREVSGSVIPEYLYEGDWNAVDTSSLNLDVDTDGGGGALQGENINSGGTAEVPLNRSTLQRDFIYNNAGIRGDVYVLRGQTVQNLSGAGSAQYKGYGGTGVALGGQGGFFKYFELQSEGLGRSNAESWTASDYRYVP